MSILDAMRNNIPERLIKPLQTKVTQTDLKRIDEAAKRMNVTRSELTRALVLQSLEPLEQELGITIVHS